ncbi:MAG TPA: flocculation-associated PEP-CTERM protein PepA [Gammaproteobacteria bacterium]|nr:flocculation-associated PEP-CTERM protein PepA [Gammaproteobacteria bacterium]
MKLKTTIPVAIAGVLFAASASAASVPWTGTANYAAGPNGVSNGDTVGPFDSYDLGVGDVLLQGQAGNTGSPASPATGDMYNGYIQDYVVQHDLNGTGVAAPHLNSTGSGSGYQLTLAGNFQEKINSTSGGITTFSLTGGNAKLYLSGTPSYNFSTDSGFTSGNPILSGTIVGGSGTFGPSNLGVTSLDFKVDNYDKNIFSPNTIAGGNSVFTLQLGGGASTSSFLSGITSVGGHTVSPGDLTLGADGNLALTAVPVPAAVWLFSSGLIGLVGVARRRSMKA